MFDPKEWVYHHALVGDKYRIFYTNTFTGLDKLRSTFTKEQQKQIDQHAKDRLKNVFLNPI